MLVFDSDSRLGSRSFQVSIGHLQIGQPEIQFEGEILVLDWEYCHLDGTQRT